MSRLFALTARTAQQLRRKLDDVGKVGRSPAAGAAARGVTWVKVTDEPTDGWHPAVVAIDIAGEMIDLEDEVLVAAADESDLTVDSYYLCTRTGDDDDGAARFRTTPAAGGLGGVTQAVFSDYSITADNTWEAVTDASVSVDAGTYLFWAGLSAWARTSTGTGAIHARLYNYTAGDLADSNCGYGLALVTAQVVNIDAFGSGTLVVPVTVLTTSTIRLEALRRPNSSATWTTSLIRFWSAAAGVHALNYIRLG